MAAQFVPFVPVEVRARRLHQELVATLKEEKRLAAQLRPHRDAMQRAQAALRVETRIFEREQAEVQHFTSVLMAVAARRTRLEDQLHRLRGAYYVPYSTMVAPPAGPVQQLPRFRCHKGIEWYFDARLGEFRQVRNPHVAVPYRSQTGQMLFAEFVNQQAHKR